MSKKLIIISLFFIGLLFAQISLKAQIQGPLPELPGAGLTPNSPFYFLERVAETIGEFLTFDSKARAKLQTKRALERIAEVKTMLAKKEINPKGLDVALSRLQINAAKAAKIVQKEQQKKKNVSMLAKELDTDFEVAKRLFKKTLEEKKSQLEVAFKKQKLELKKQLIEAKVASNVQKVDEINLSLDKLKQKKEAQELLFGQKKEELEIALKIEEEKFELAMEEKEREIELKEKEVELALEKKKQEFKKQLEEAKRTLEKKEEALENQFDAALALGAPQDIENIKTQLLAIDDEMSLLNSKFDETDRTFNEVERNFEFLLLKEERTLEDLVRQKESVLKVEGSSNYVCKYSAAGQKCGGLGAYCGGANDPVCCAGMNCYYSMCMAKLGASCSNSDQCNGPCDKNVIDCQLGKCCGRHAYPCSDDSACCPGFRCKLSSGFCVAIDSSTSGSLKIIDPGDGIYLGAYDWDDGIKTFERAIGKKIAAGKPSYIQDRGTESTLPYFDTIGHEKAYREGYITTYGIEAGLDSAGSKFSPQDIVDGKIDNELKQVAQEIKKWGRPLFWLYPREPAIQPLPGYDGGGYGPLGKDTRGALEKYGGDIYGQYNSPLKTSCDTQEDIMCLDGPERYRDMSRHIHDVVESVAPNQITWVMGADVGWQKGHYKMFYPGDNYVDWHAFDRYPGGEGSLEPYNSFSNHILWKEALDLADKPIIIIEFGVYKKENNDRGKWFESFFKDVRTNPKMKNLKAFMYWQMTGMAFDDPAASTRIEPTDPEAKIWQQEMQANANFWLSCVKLANGSKAPPNCEKGTTEGAIEENDETQIGETGETNETEDVTNTLCYKNCIREPDGTDAGCRN